MRVARSNDIFRVSRSLVQAAQPDREQPNDSLLTLEKAGVTPGSSGMTCCKARDSRTSAVSGGARPRRRILRYRLMTCSGVSAAAGFPGVPGRASAADRNGTLTSQVSSWQ
jgi:hypothetical protein